MPHKTLVSITGTSTAGKTSLAKVLLESGKFYPIPHATNRSVRRDDDPRLMKNLPAEEYAEQEFLTCHGDYGTLKSDVESFLKSDCPYGVTVNSSLDMMTLSGLYSEQGSLLHGVNRCHVLVCISDHIGNELMALRERLSVFFSGEEYARRLELHSQLVREYFFSEIYREGHIDLVLSQKQGTLAEWAKKLSSFIGADIFPNGQSLETASSRVRNETTLLRSG